MSIQQRWFALSIALALSAPALRASAADTAAAAGANSANSALTVLIQQGKYWQAHRRGDLAQQAWEKILRIDANQPDALFGMATVAADRNEAGVAQQYLTRLRRVAPQYPELGDLARRLGEVTPRDQALDAARHLAQAGQAASATAQYQQVLHGKAASPQVLLEYYQTLGGTPAGWDQARQGLTQLAHDHPDEPKYALALAQHLTYRDVTRRQGIEQLARLATDPAAAALAPQVKASWRQALLWLGARAADAPLYQAYLQSAPNDTAVKARYDAMVAQDKTARVQALAGAAGGALGRADAQGFAALDRGDTDSAVAAFSGVLKEAPNNTDALGGMGVALLKQEKFKQAHDYLLRASAGPNPGRWKQALTSATYWTYTSAAMGAHSNGENAQAKQLFERAIAVDPTDVTAQTMLGETLLSMHDARGAEAAYRMALRRQADNPDAMRGLVAALAAEGKSQEALDYANQLSAEQRARVGGIDQLRGTAQVAEARAAEARGDIGTARSKYEDALLNRPDDPWLRLDLARIYVKQGALANAKSVMDGLLAAHPDMPDALYASALLASELQDWSGGLAALERIPAAQRTGPMTALQNRLWVHQQISQASSLAQAGRMAQAHAMLQGAEPLAGRDLELLGALAGGYVQSGDSSRALALMRGALTAAGAQSAPDAGLLLEYAGILVATGQDAELGAVMRRVAALPLTPPQRADFDKINVAIVVRQVDALRRRGDLAGAYDAMAQWLVARPADADLQAALGRLYTSAGEASQALQCYRNALAARPGDVGLMLAAAGAATATKDFSYAKTTLDAALRLAPNDPRLLVATGQMYRAQGKNSLAAAYLRRSLLAENMSPAERRAAQGWNAPYEAPRGTPLPGVNPFAGKTAVDTLGTAPGAAAGFAPPNYAAAPAGNLLPTYRTQTMPYYPPISAPPASPPAYIAPANPGAPAAPWPGAPRAAAYGAGAGDSVGPDQYGSSQAGSAYGGGAYAPPPYPQQPYPQPPYPQQAYQQQAHPPAAYDAQPYAQNPSYGQYPAASAPWPQPGQAPSAKPARSKSKKTRAASAATRPAPATRAPARYAAGYAPPAAQAYPQPYPPQAYAPQPYAQQPYAQQPYVPQPYAQQPYAQQPYPAQPYVPQAPAAYAVYPGVPAGVAPVQPYAQGDAAGGAAVDAARPLTVEEELAEINRERTSTVAGGLVIRNRSGEAGLSSLTDIEAPVEGRIQAGDGHVIVRATPVTLDASTPSNSQNTLLRLGVGGNTGSQNASGMGVAVGYETTHLRADVGSTPIGFRETNVVGGLQYSGALTDQVSFGLNASRRAVTDSLLSYAGLREDVSGQTWGGVTANGLRGDLGWDDGTNGVYVNATYQYLTGHNVESNTAEKGGGGVYTRLFKNADQTLTAGVNATLMSYAKNLNYYTYGQGGYFSPQQYLILNLPLEWAGRNGRLAYDVKGSIGVQHFRTDSSPYFPTNAAAQRLAAASGLEPDANAIYPGQSKTGLAYAFSAYAEYQLAPQLTVGAGAEFGNAYQYNEWVASVYVRYAFTKLGSTPTIFPPTPLRSPYLPMTN